MGTRAKPNYSRFIFYDAMGLEISLNLNYKIYKVALLAISSTSIGLLPTLPFILGLNSLLAIPLGFLSIILASQLGFTSLLNANCPQYFEPVRVINNDNQNNQIIDSLDISQVNLPSWLSGKNENDEPEFVIAGSNDLQIFEAITKVKESNVQFGIKSEKQPKRTSIGIEEPETISLRTQTVDYTATINFRKVQNDEIITNVKQLNNSVLNGLTEAFEQLNQ